MSTFDVVVTAILAITLLAAKVNGKYCDGGEYCAPPKTCCPTGCCSARPPNHITPPTFLDFVIWNRGFFWCLFLVFTIFCLGGCSLWCRGKSFRLCGSCRGRHEEERLERDSAGSCCAPPRYSECDSLQRRPPAYHEVTSKPELYPVVITYTGSKSRNYLMVQYFRNFLVHPPIGSISAGTTIDSISSSFLDSNVPPPYEEPSTGTNRVDESASTAQPKDNNGSQIENQSTAGIHKQYTREPQRYCKLHYHSTDLLARDAPTSLSSDELSIPRGSLQDFVSSCSAQHFSTSSEVSSLFGWSRPVSPPRATSPTCMELRDLCDRINALPNEIPSDQPTTSNTHRLRPPVKSKTFHLSFRPGKNPLRKQKSVSAPVTPLAPLHTDRSLLLIQQSDSETGDEMF